MAVQELSRRKLRTIYSEAPFADKREPDADGEQSDGYLVSIDLLGDSDLE